MCCASRVCTWSYVICSQYVKVRITKSYSVVCLKGLYLVLCYLSCMQMKCLQFRRKMHLLGNWRPASMYMQIIYNCLPAAVLNAFGYVHKNLEANPEKLRCIIYSSQEIRNIIPVPLRHVRTMRSSTHPHPFQVLLHTSRTLSHKSSFIPRTCNMWNLLPSSCFPESYNLPSFKSKIDKLDLITLSS